jgi:hypothetical protein
VSSGKIQIALRNVSSSKRPVEIPWAPKPKDEAKIQLAPSETQSDPKLIKAIVRAQAWLNQLANGHHTSIDNLAAAAGYNPKVIRQGQVTAAALNGEMPVRLKGIPKLLPLSWREQRLSID